MLISDPGETGAVALVAALTTPPGEIVVVAVPAAISAMNPSVPPLFFDCGTPTVTGKLVDAELPTTASPAVQLTATASAESSSVPPMKLENCSVLPAGVSPVTVPSDAPRSVAWNPKLDGKFAELVAPAMYAAPVESTAIPLPIS